MLAALTILFASTASERSWAQTPPEPGDDRFEVSTVSSGPGWTLINIHDTSRSSTALGDTELYFIEGVKGAYSSPLHAAEKAYIQQYEQSQSAPSGPATLSGSAGKESGKIYIIHKQISDSFRATGSIPLDYLQYADAQASSCNGVSEEHVEESITPAFPISGNQPLNTGSISGSMDYSTDLNTQVNMGFRYRVHRVFCIPYLVEFLAFDIDARLGLDNGNLKIALNSVQEAENTWKKEILKPTLWRLPFTVGPIPVVINFKLPVNVGLVASGQLSSSAEVTADFRGHFNFDYACRSGGCAGSSDFGFSFSRVNKTASVETDLKAKPFLDARVRANLYSDSLVFGEVGLRAGIQNRLWFYAGNDCGLPDQGHENDPLIRGAMFDSYFDLQLPYAYGGALGDGEDFVDLWKKSIFFRDLLGGHNNALAPRLTGPTTVTAGMEETYQLEMRPCYPLTDDVSLNLSGAFANSVDQSYDLDTDESIDLKLVFSRAGERQATAANVKDTFGRTIQSLTRLPVTVMAESEDPVCHDSCPPIVWTEWETVDVADLRNTELDYSWRLGFDLDPGNYSFSSVDSFLWADYFDLAGRFLGQASDPEGTLKLYLDEISDFQAQHEYYQTGDPFLSSYGTVCIAVDPDYHRRLSRNSMAARLCFSVNNEFFPFNFIAELVNRDDVRLTWQDNDRDSGNNNFLIQRKKDSGSFQAVSLSVNNSEWPNLSAWDRDLDPGLYQYRISNNGGQGWNLSDLINIAVPEIDFVLQASENDVFIPGHIRLSWSRPCGANPTTIWEILGQSSRRIIGFTGSGSSSRLHGPVPIETPLSFQVECELDGETLSSNIATGIATGTTVNFGLAASDRDPTLPGKILVSWNDLGAETYWIGRRKQGSGSIEEFTFSGQTSFLDQEVEPETNYTYWIKLHPDLSWDLAESDSGEAAPLPPLENILEIEASDEELDFVQVDWVGVAGATSYEVFRTTDPSHVDPAAHRVGTVSGATTVYFDVNAPVDTDLYYWVRGTAPGMHGELVHNDHGFRPVIIQDLVPDLIVQHVVAPEQAEPSEAFEVTFEVKNIGTEEAVAHLIQVFLVAGDSFTRDFCEVEDTATIIAPGDSITRSCTGSVESEFQAHLGNGAVKVSADYGDALFELRENNNDRLKPLTVVGLPADLYFHVSGVSMSPAAPQVGEFITFTFVMHNSGGGIFGEPAAQMSVSGSGFSETFTCSEGIPNAGDCIRTVSVEATQGGAHTVTATADPSGEITETFENNNTRSLNYVVGDDDIESTCEGTWHLTGINGNEFNTSAQGSVVDDCHVYFAQNTPTGCFQSTGHDELATVWHRAAGEQCPSTATVTSVQGEVWEYAVAIE